mmetsp:Transcript_82965/g.231473  ORF Transcript_82965/g.231473 Transcript_82965/m.231473 type:complete len:234 (-) Transcript_82965:42-743(-)
MHVVPEVLPQLATSLETLPAYAFEMLSVRSVHALRGQIGIICGKLFHKLLGLDDLHRMPLHGTDVQLAISTPLHLEPLFVAFFRDFLHVAHAGPKLLDHRASQDVFDEDVAIRCDLKPKINSFVAEDLRQGLRNPDFSGLPLLFRLPTARHCAVRAGGARSDYTGAEQNRACAEGVPVPPAHSRGTAACPQRLARCARPQADWTHHSVMQPPCSNGDLCNGRRSGTNIAGAAR